ncbi:hypothetical protein D9K77_13030 [Klebsiella pneumoniae]|nr:hypothetical protein D9K77_13030 [Klebsiella pneumoniae]
MRGAYHWYRRAEIPIIAAFDGQTSPFQYMKLFEMRLKTVSVLNKPHRGEAAGRVTRGQLEGLCVYTSRLIRSQKSYD